jgi:predicted glycoside hydrolase/deacetylase ChbG (UPF0249 family)
LIVNADDFGLTDGVTRGILAAHRHGIVTSSTMLVNAGIARDRAAEARDRIAEARDTGLALGLHVNFTLGAPLTRGRSLVGSDGRFVRDPKRAAARAELREVEKEIAAQIEKFMQMVKRAPTHLDSHHHVGTYSPVREAFLGAAAELGVPVRSEDAGTRATARSRRLATPDHFFGGSGPGPYWTLATTLEHLRRLPPGVSEFMTHPGFFDQDLAYSRYGRQRETEMVGLGTSAARAAATALGIGLSTFGQLSWGPRRGPRTPAARSNPATP